MQPEVRAVQVTILIHAAHSHSSHASHACPYITLQLFTGSCSSFSSRLFYRLKILFDRDTNKCFDNLQGHNSVPGQVTKQVLHV